MIRCTRCFVLLDEKLLLLTDEKAEKFRQVLFEQRNGFRVHCRMGNHTRHIHYIC